MTTVRDKMEAKMRETLIDNARFHDWVYAAIRPLSVPHTWKPGQRVIADCSKGCQYIAHWGDAPDPMGRHFDPYGNSTTMTAHLPHLDHPSELQVGDYITFGFYGSEHAAIVLERGSDPLLWSMGHPGAPNTYRLSADHRVHYLLHNPTPKAPLTPKEKLRLKKGFWAWYQWSLGLGHWHHYGKKNKSVKTIVPKRIPLRWWKHRARLLMLRRKMQANPPTTMKIQEST